MDTQPQLPGRDSIPAEKGIVIPTFGLLGTGYTHSLTSKNDNGEPFQAFIPAHPTLVLGLGCLLISILLLLQTYLHLHFCTELTINKVSRLTSFMWTPYNLTLKQTKESTRKVGLLHCSWNLVSSGCPILRRAEGKAIPTKRSSLSKVAHLPAFPMMKQLETTPWLAKHRQNAGQARLRQC